MYGVPRVYPSVSPRREDRKLRRYMKIAVRGLQSRLDIQKFAKKQKLEVPREDQNEAVKSHLNVTFWLILFAEIAISQNIPKKDR